MSQAASEAAEHIQETQPLQNQIKIIEITRDGEQNCRKQKGNVGEPDSKSMVLQTATNLRTMSNCRE